MKRAKLEQSILRILFGLEFFVWIIFIYGTAECSLSTKPILSFVMILLLVFIAAWSFWFILKDYLAGLYIRATGRLKLNQSIAFDDIEGKLAGFSNNYLLLETANSDITEIPYSRLLAKNIEYLSKSAEEELTINFELKNSKYKEAFIRKIKSGILEMPWVNHQFGPQIKIVDRDGKNIIELKIILLDKKYRSRVAEFLRELE